MIRQEIEERAETTPETLAAIVADTRPVVLRGLVRDWPLVAAGVEGDGAVADYLVRRDAGLAAETFVGDPAIGGRFFYDAGFKGFNFTRRPSTVTALVRQLGEAAGMKQPPALYMGAATMERALPGFAAENPTPAIPDHAVGRLWLGNAVTVQTHYDLSANLACVAAGSRTFTLFPPEQGPNLYVGPLEFTLAGQPVSLVDPMAPDHRRFPLYAQAEAQAMTATLAPGDALYIPPLWWHHVRSHRALNVLVNFWWSTAPAGAGSPFEALIHGVLSIRHLPQAERAGWKALFEHLVFDADDQTAAHIPEAARGVRGELTPETAALMRRFLIGSLSKT